MKDTNKFFRHYAFFCIIIGYIPLIFFGTILFLYPKINLDKYPQHAFAWTLLWSIPACIFCKFSPKTSNIKMKIITLLAQIPIAVFGAFLLIALLIVLIFGSLPMVIRLKL
jgi:hypothetical protein